MNVKEPKGTWTRRIYGAYNKNEKRKKLDLKLKNGYTSYRNSAHYITKKIQGEKMRNLVTAMGILIISLLMVFSIVSMNIDQTKKNDLEENTKVAIYQTLKECEDDEQWPGIANEYADVRENLSRGFSKDDVIMNERFKENLQLLLKRNDKVQVKIVESDRARGILRVITKSTYSNLGKKRTVQTDKTVVMDRYTVTDEAS